MCACACATRQDLEGEMSGIDVGGDESLGASLEVPEVRWLARRRGGGGVCALATPCLGVLPTVVV